MADRPVASRWAVMMGAWTMFYAGLLPAIRKLARRRFAYFGISMQNKGFGKMPGTTGQRRSRRQGRNRFLRIMMALFASLSAASAAHNSRNRALAMESLEPRLPLSAAGLIDVGTQPEGSLAGKVVFTHGGHGYVANNLTTGAWGAQRPLLLDMNEDQGNKDQMDFFADYLFRAGATIVPLRPVGHQPNEVILDNDDPGVTFTGNWSNSSSGIYYGDAGDVPYRFASVSAAETATATYTPNIPVAGFYPVYTWVRYGSDRAVDHLYKINHTGGTTEVTINHQMVGNGPVYLGSYYFDAGTDGSVVISNRSTGGGSVVIADMIRFGNGRGDINRGGGISGFDREDEAGLYWVQWHVDRSQGISITEYRTSSEDRSAAVSFSPRYAEYMNREAAGSLSDRVFVSFHSNAGGGGARGVLGLLNGNNRASAATPNQFLLADTLAREVNDDLISLVGQFEHEWDDQGAVVTLDRTDIEFGEINNEVIGNEFDATIVETGYHDNTLDARMLRDPKVRDALARATYQGLVRYFNAVDSGATPQVMLPAPVDGVRAVATADGTVTVSWNAAQSGIAIGDAATGYKVYTSANGYGFDGGRDVAGGATTSLEIAGLTAGETYYFKVVATNSAGESAGSEVVANAAQLAEEKVLIVTGFDRLDRSLNPKQTFIQGGLVDRVRPRQSNSFDYSVQMAEALNGADVELGIDTASNESIIADQIDLDDYDAVFWILGEESSADDTFNSAEQDRVSDYLAQGGSLFASGAEIGWDLDNLNNGKAFYNNTLHASYVLDDANTYQAQGTAGGIFDGINLTFDDGDQFYDVNFPDVIAPSNGSTAALTYSGGTGGTAAVQFNNSVQRVVMMGFPFETITDAAVRTTVMERVLEYFEVEGDSTPTVSQTFILDNDDGMAVYSTNGSWITSGDPGYEGGTFQFGLVGSGSAGVASWTTELPKAGTAQISVQYVAAGNRATGAAFEVENASNIETASINQQQGNLVWVPVATMPVEAGTITVRLDATNSTGAANSLVIADAVRIVVISPLEPSGDFNTDGIVDAADYTVWRDNLGSSVTPGTSGDADFDGAVTTADYAIWKEQFGTIITPPAAASFYQPPAAPLSEPTTGSGGAAEPLALPLGFVVEPTANSAQASTDAISERVAEGAPVDAREQALIAWLESAAGTCGADDGGVQLHKVIEWNEDQTADVQWSLAEPWFAELGSD